MSLPRYTTFVDGEVLFAADLEGEFDNIVNGGEDLAWPATKNKDLDGNSLILDSAAVSLLRVSVANTFQYVNQGVIQFQVDGTTSTPLVGVSVVAGASGTDPIIQPINEANHGINIVTNGTGVFQVDGDPLGTHTDSVLGAEVFGR